jgi:fatty acid desaturase
MKHTNAFHHMPFFGTGNEDSSSPTRRTQAMLVGAVGLWFLAAFIGGTQNIFNQPGVPPVTVGMFLLVPIGFFYSRLCP